MQMLRQIVSPNQRDWAIKLPAIEFAINSACSDTTKYPPFVLNYGHLPPPFIWNTNSDFPGVRVFAQRMKDAVMSAHDSIIAARVKNTSNANCKRAESPFVKGDLVYLSTENLSLPKGRARKLAPKYIGPYHIIDDYRNNSFLLDLPSQLKQRGIHPAFHAHLLRLHVPNDNRHFPGRQLEHVSDIGHLEEWSVSRIADHQGTGPDALFEVEYSTGDRVWLPYYQVSCLEALSQYLEALGVPGISHLLRKISAASNSISVCVTEVFSKARDIVFGVTDLMLSDLASNTPLSESTSSYLTGEQSSCHRYRYPSLMPSLSPPPNDAMLVDVEPTQREPGEFTQTCRSTQVGRGRPGRGRRGRGGHPFPPRRPEEDVDTLGAFTRFFRAEAQASELACADTDRAFTHCPSPYPEELATRKESHAFDQELRAECHNPITN